MLVFVLHASIMVAYSEVIYKNTNATKTLANLKIS